MNKFGDLFKSTNIEFKKKKLKQDLKITRLGSKNIQIENFDINKISNDLIKVSRNTHSLYNMGNSYNEIASSKLDGKLLNINIESYNTSAEISGVSKKINKNEVRLDLPKLSFSLIKEDMLDGIKDLSRETQNTLDDILNTSKELIKNTEARYIEFNDFITNIIENKKSISDEKFCVELRNDTLGKVLSDFIKSENGIPVNGLNSSLLNGLINPLLGVNNFVSTDLTTIANKLLRLITSSNKVDIDTDELVVDINNLRGLLSKSVLESCSVSNCYKEISGKLSNDEFLVDISNGIFTIKKCNDMVTEYDVIKPIEAMTMLTDIGTNYISLPYIAEVYTENFVRQMTNIKTTVDNLTNTILDNFNILIDVIEYLITLIKTKTETNGLTDEDLIRINILNNGISNILYLGVGIHGIMLSNLTEKINYVNTNI